MYDINSYYYEIDINSLVYNSFIHKYDLNGTHGHRILISSIKFKTKDLFNYVWNIFTK